MLTWNSKLRRTKAYVSKFVAGTRNLIPVFAGAGGGGFLIFIVLMVIALQCRRKAVSLKRSSMH